MTGQIRFAPDGKKKIMKAKYNKNQGNNRTRKCGRKSPDRGLRMVWDKFIDRWSVDSESIFRC